MSNSSDIQSNTPYQRALKSLGEEIVKRRKLYHLPQKVFAKEIGIEAAQLCKMEHGKHLPNVEILKKIEDFLGMTPGALLNVRSSILRACNFDIKSVTLEKRLTPACDAHSIPDDALQALRETIRPTLDEYAELEGKIRIPSNCRISLGTLRMSTSRDGIAAAHGFRDAIGATSGSLVALLPKLERVNFRLLPVDDLPPIILNDGTTKRRDAFSFHDRIYDNAVICVNQKSAPYEQLYDIAYEVGSYLRFRRLAATGTHRAEHLFCRAFASTLLMPECEIRDIIDGLAISDDGWSFRLMDNIALRFGVSCQALLWHLDSMSRIDQESFDLIRQKLKDPSTYANTSVFAPRPPLVFGSWLATLRLRAENVR